MQLGTEARVKQARHYLRRRAWADAFEALRLLDAEGALPEDALEELADAADWCGHLDECIAALERAYSAHIAAGHRRQAISVAIWLSRQYSFKAARAIGAGWLARAERLLEQEGDCPELAGFHLRLSRDLTERGMLDAALENARHCQTVAHRHADREMEVVGMHQEGQLRVRLGDLGPGMRLIDEASAAALGGELS